MYSVSESFDQGQVFATHWKPHSNRLPNQRDNVNPMNIYQKKFNSDMFC